MRIGFFLLNADDGADVLEVASAADALGYESIFLPDHSHVPVESRSQFPSGPELPAPYYRMLDPLVTCGAVAAVTKSIRIGTGICLVPQWDAIHLAKAVATIDHLSEGRMLFGVGAGWAVEEMQNHGVDPNTRWAAMAERVKAIRVIWTNEQAEYHGRFVDFDPIYSWPKPKQSPHPPVLVGGNGPNVLKRVLDFGDEWIPSYRPKEPGFDLRKRIAELQSLCARAGRAMPPMSLMGAPAERLDEFAAMGFQRCVLPVPVGPTAAVIETLEALAPCIERYR